MIHLASVGNRFAEKDNSCYSPSGFGDWLFLFDSYCWFCLSNMGASASLQPEVFTLAKAEYEAKKDSGFTDEALFNHMKIFIEEKTKEIAKQTHADATSATPAAEAEHAVEPTEAHAVEPTAA
jgi:hypothetical protein